MLLLHTDTKAQPGEIRKHAISTLIGLTLILACLSPPIEAHFPPVLRIALIGLGISFLAFGVLYLLVPCLENLGESFASLLRRCSEKLRTLQLPFGAWIRDQFWIEPKEDEE